MANIAKIHHAAIAWRNVTTRIRLEMAQRGVHPSQTVVLLPYAQLMQEAKAAWIASADGGPAAAQFLPRFETTQNWTRSQGGFEPTGDDIRLDAAFDVLTATSLLVRAGLAQQQAVLAQRLMEAAWSLAKVAAAVAPQDRAAWGQRLGADLANGLDTPALALEAATGRIALAWAANSSYVTDVLFAAPTGLLVALEGFQTEPLPIALLLRQGANAVSMALHGPTQAGPSAGLALHPAPDAEDEAQTAAACVLQALQNADLPQHPVALVATDRLLTRRVRASLSGRGIAVRDETGWKLSTTRAAATLMSLLRACARDAATDAVLDWLKNAPAFAPAAVTQAEKSCRKLGLRDWYAVAGHPDDNIVANQALIGPVNQLRNSLQRSRTLVEWLNDLRTALQNAGHWQALQNDRAGLAVLAALRLNDGNAELFAAFATRLSANEFSAWVSQTLESESFLPAHPQEAQVVILPLSQLLGRQFSAVVLPGCDEVRLPTSAEPAGQWTPAQRQLLGLPSREDMAVANRKAWLYALQSPRIDLLWRQSEGGESIMPSGFVQEILLHQALPMAADPRTLRELVAQPCSMPQPRGDALPITRLSSSAYEDLRRCPYRFFALRQLRLQESDELDVELGKRDFGNWLHTTLKIFHDTLNLEQKEAKTHDRQAQAAMINRASEQATQALGLSPSEFLPFAASWPRVRTGYLQWLAEHQASGATFTEAEAWKEMQFGALTLIGKIDRIDKKADGHALVIDYKTEGRNTTAERVKPDSEDTQLAFYAALLHDDTLDGAYVNVGEKDATKSYSPPDFADLRDQLIAAAMDDMARIGQGAALPALGEGKACDFCAARGLCRKDFWSTN
jgi:ATP-dependent helicase/nuclease subunit B